MYIKAFKKHYWSFKEKSRKGTIETEISFFFLRKKGEGKERNIKGIRKKGEDIKS